MATTSVEAKNNVCAEEYLRLRKVWAKYVDGFVERAARAGDWLGRSETDRADAQAVGGDDGGGGRSRSADLRGSGGYALASRHCGG